MTFVSFRTPVQSDRRSEFATAAADAGAPGLPRSRPILIVDDDAEFADRLSAELAGLGYAAARTRDVSTATVLLQQLEPAVVMMDHRLAGGRSGEALTKLSAQRPDLIVVTMGREIETSAVLRALRRGAYDHFDKAMGEEELAEILERCVAEAEHRRQVQATHEQLRLAKEAAEAANLAKSEFLATMGHELRTPLNAVIGFSEVILSEALGAVGNDQYKGYLQDIHTSGTHLLEVINNVLDLSKAEAGRLDLLEQRIDVRRTVETVLRMVRPRAADAGLEIISTVPTDLPALRGDEPKLKKILLNLLSNAVKFTPNGGRVEIEAATTRQGAMTIEIRDTGIGIAEGNIAKILEPFRQADGSLNRRYDGAGLGLPLALAFTELHGGSLTISSRPGRGTSVVLEFPAARVESVGE